jgi:hypothetical protein
MNGEPPELDAAFVDFFKALQDSGRLRVAGAIVAGPRSAAELARALEMPLPAVAKHLAYLVAAEFAIVTGEGAAARYRWNEARVRALSAQLLDSPRVRALAGANDERSRVLASFFRDGRLTHLPTGEARKEIVLDHIFTRFKSGRTYTEREVNQILKEFSEDYTTIRRALVDRVYLNRQDGVYWVGEGRQSGRGEDVTALP